MLQNTRRSAPLPVKKRALSHHCARLGASTAITKQKYYGPPGGGKCHAVWSFFSEKRQKTYIAKRDTKIFTTGDMLLCAAVVSFFFGVFKMEEQLVP